MLYLCAVIEYDCDSNVIAVQFVLVILLFQNYVKTIYMSSTFCTSLIRFQLKLHLVVYI